MTVAVLFAARLFDVSLSPWQLVTVLITTVFTTFSPRRASLAAASW
ncbi:MAG: hypothetical protein R2882_11350 [Gemmatimonadales bacterium]